MATKTETVQVGGGGIGFMGLLTIVFIVLKLTGVINWSWLWVLAPLWIPWAIIGIVCFMVLSIAIICFVAIQVMKMIERRKRKK